MPSNNLVPTPYHHKSPLRFKHYDIFYNKDSQLTKIAPNQHNYYEFYFLISGAVNYHIENKNYILTNGDILLISPNQLHSADIDPTIPYERYVLWLSTHYIEILSSKQTNLSNIFRASYVTGQKVIPPHDVFLQLQQLLNSIFINSKAQNYGSDLLANAYIIELLVSLAQTSLFCFDNGNSLYLTESQGKEYSLTLQALKYIEDHIYRPIKIQDICDNCFVSRSQLSKIFCAELGLPVHQYILKKKLFLARQDIKHGIPVQEAAEKYSFQNYSAFYKAFCKEFGQNPRSFKLHNNS